MRLRHTGNGVEIYAPSGLQYTANPGQVVDFVGTDGDYLADNHPEWERLDDDYSEDQSTNRDDSGEEE